MPDIQPIDVGGIFEKASGHKLVKKPYVSPQLPKLNTDTIAVPKDT